MTIFRRKACAVTPVAAPGPAIDHDREEVLELGRNRLVVVGALFALAFTIIGGRLVDLSAFQAGLNDFNIAAAGDRPAVSRADIVDRNGVVLATDLATASLYAEPRRVLDAVEAAGRLLNALPELDRRDLVGKLTSGKGFVWLKRHLTPKQQYAVNALGIPGIGFRTDHRRVYPQGSLFAHVVGHTGVDNEGLTGVEKQFDADLAQDARKPAGAAAQAFDGGRLRLGLDVRVQFALQRELADAVEEFSALGAAGIVMDVRSGEVLAMVSLPDFDLNSAGNASADARFNRASLGVYEMGSTFKAFTTAMALDAGTVKIGGGYDATKPIRVARFTIRDDHPKKRWLSVPEIFIYSSNIGAAKMALDVGGERQRDFLDRLGMLRKAALEMPEVGRPMSPARWRDINTMTVAFGHGIAVSPTQLASGVAALVNGGTRVEATLLAQSADKPRTPGPRVIKARTSSIMQRLMRLNVVRGTGKKAIAAGYMVGGKTGTAEKAGAGGYRRKALLSSFVGAFPMNDPRYVVLAVIDEPKGTKATFGYATGGWTAAPVVGRVVSRIAPILGVTPVNEDSRSVRDAMFVPVKTKGVKLGRLKRGGHRVAAF